MVNHYLNSISNFRIKFDSFSSFCPKAFNSHLAWLLTLQNWYCPFEVLRFFWIFSLILLLVKFFYLLLFNFHRLLLLKQIRSSNFQCWILCFRLDKIQRLVSFKGWLLWCIFDDHLRYWLPLSCGLILANRLLARYLDFFLFPVINRFMCLLFLSFMWFMSTMRMVVVMMMMMVTFHSVSVMTALTSMTMLGRFLRILR